MKQFDHVVQSPEGIHARPAMQLAGFAKSLSGKVTVSCGGRTVSAKNLIQLLTLHAGRGAEVTFTVEGPEEIKETERLREFCRKNV